MTTAEQMRVYNDLVQRFSAEMLRVLENHARYTVGHRRCNAAWLTVKLLEEAGEVAKLLRRSLNWRTGRLENISAQNTAMILRECADVANIAMMLADIVGSRHD